jgi:hypothetical protein
MSDAGTNGHSQATKMNLNIDLITDIKIKSEWVIDLKCQPETVFCPSAGNKTKGLAHAWQTVYH